MIEINLTQDFKGKDIKFKTDKDGNLKRDKNGKTSVDKIDDLIMNSVGSWKKGNTQEIFKFLTIGQAYNGLYGTYYDRMNHFILSAVVNKNNWEKPSFIPQSAFSKKWEIGLNGKKTYQSKMSKLGMWIKKNSELTEVYKRYKIFTQEGKRLLKVNGLSSYLYPNEVKYKYSEIWELVKDFTYWKGDWHFVVNVEQIENLLGTENEKILKTPKTLEDRFNMEKLKTDKKFIKMLTTNMENVPTVNFHLEETAFYSRLDDSINIRPSDKMTDYSKFVSTTIHELAHSTGHKDRKNRHSLMTYDGHSRSLEELVAEITVLFSLNRFNDDDLDKDFLRNNIGLYLQSWLGHAKKELTKEKRVSRLLIASRESATAEKYIFTNE